MNQNTNYRQNNNYRNNGHMQQSNQMWQQNQMGGNGDNNAGNAKKFNNNNSNSYRNNNTAVAPNTAALPAAPVAAPINNGTQAPIMNGSSGIVMAEGSPNMNGAMQNHAGIDNRSVEENTLVFELLQPFLFFFCPFDRPIRLKIFNTICICEDSKNTSIPFKREKKDNFI